MRMFYNFETDEYLTIWDLYKSYQEFKTEYEDNFEYYISGCMHRNNGSLYTIDEREQALKNKLIKIPVDNWHIDDIISVTYELKKLYGFKENHFLFHDEISDILYHAPDGCTVSITTFDNNCITFELCQYFDEIFLVNKKTDKTFNFVRSVNMLYDCIENGFKVTIDGKSIIVAEGK